MPVSKLQNVNGGLGRKSQVYDIVERCFTLQDLMTNLVGGIIGYLVYKLLFIKKVSKLRTIILNVLSVVVIIVFVPILLYGIINTIKHFDVYIDILTRRL